MNKTRIIKEINEVKGVDMVEALLNNNLLLVTLKEEEEKPIAVKCDNKEQFDFILSLNDLHNSFDKEKKNIVSVDCPYLVLVGDESDFENYNITLFNEYIFGKKYKEKYEQYLVTLAKKKGYVAGNYILRDEDVFKLKTNNYKATAYEIWADEFLIYLNGKWLTLLIKQQ